MTYEEILPLIRRERFVPLRLLLKDGRTYDLWRFGQFAVVPYIIKVRLPYEAPLTSFQTDIVEINYPEIQDVVEVPEMTYGDTGEVSLESH